MSCNPHECKSAPWKLSMIRYASALRRKNALSTPEIIDQHSLRRIVLDPNNISDGLGTLTWAIIRQFRRLLGQLSGVIWTTTSPREIHPRSSATLARPQETLGRPWKTLEDSQGQELKLQDRHTKPLTDSLGPRWTPSGLDRHDDLQTETPASRQTSRLLDRHHNYWTDTSSS